MKPKVHYLVEIPADWGEYERTIFREEVEKIIEAIERLRGHGDAVLSEVQG